MQLVLQALRALAETNQSLTHSALDPHDLDKLPYPGLPITSAPSTASYWSAHNRGASNRLIGYGRNDEVPEHADAVIIGAGISGATVAHFLLNSGDKSLDTVVLLEAREVSSSATGRNGGFIKPVPFRTYGDYKALFGMDEALHLIQSEYDALDLTIELAEEGAIDAGFALRPHREIVLDRTTARSDRKLLDLIRADRGRTGSPQIDDVQWYNDTTEARLLTRSKTAVEAYTYTCGSIWPHKFVHGLISSLLASSKRLHLFAHTPATSIHRIPNSNSSSSSSSNTSPLWLVQTSRGSITTPKLIITTNGYTSTLLPSLFMGRIVPKRTQMAAYTLPESFGPPLEFTYNIRGVRNSSAGADVEQSPLDMLGAETSIGGAFEEAYGLTTSDGTLVMGSELAQRASDEDGVRWLGSADDTEVFGKTTEYYRQMPRTNFAGWDAEGVGEGLFRTWTGIQGHTLDTLPFVGAVPGHEGLFVSAGFHGHGMARCVVASRGLVHQLLSPTNEWDARLPRSFEITEKRLNATAESVLADLIRGRENTWDRGTP